MSYKHSSVSQEVLLGSKYSLKFHNKAVLRMNSSGTSYRQNRIIMSPSTILESSDGVLRMIYFVLISSLANPVQKFQTPNPSQKNGQMNGLHIRVSPDRGTQKKHRQHKRKSILNPSWKMHTEILKSIHTRRDNKVTSHHLFHRMKHKLLISKKMVKLSITDTNNSYRL